MFEHGVHRAGYLTVPDRPDLVFDFLEPRWTTIQHYGVQIDSLRYDGPALVPYRNTASPFTGAHAGRWPIAVDPADVTQVYFQDPADNRWHTLLWEHAAALGRPLSAEALGYARSLATRQHRFPDTKRAVTELLDRWGAGLTDDAAERRMAMRQSAQNLRLLDPEPAGAPSALTDAAALPTVARIGALTAPADDLSAAHTQGQPIGVPSVHTAAQHADVSGTEPAGQPTSEVGALSDEEFYADAMDSA